MYINQFVARVLVTIIVEVALVIVAAVVKYNNDKKELREGERNIEM